ncbi:MAG: hypothetical protein Q7W56_10145 [Candidatus Latescibacteria bacterium]|nr:hypothetical protein [Candidatus Latescibacterota bacterium]
MRIPALILLSLCLLGAVQAAWYAPELPERPASSFGGDGVANGWSDKDSFLAMQIALLVLTAGLFLLIGWLLPRIPVRWINLPHPQYWLDGTRRAATLAAVSRSLAWFGCVTTLFLLWTFQITILANLADPPRMPAAVFWSGFVAYMAYSTWWTLRLILRYQRLPSRG